VTPCVGSVQASRREHERGGSRLLRDVGDYLPVDMASYFRRLEASYEICLHKFIRILVLVFWFVVVLRCHKDTHRLFSKTNVPLWSRFRVISTQNSSVLQISRAVLLKSKTNPQRLCCSVGFGYLSTALQAVLP